MKKTLGFIGLTVFLVLVTAFCVTDVVRSQSREDMEVSERYYQELVSEYKQEIREYLEEQGFVDSGIMITRTVLADGSREYLVTIHHGKIDKLNEEKRAELLRNIVNMAFVEEGCSFQPLLTGNA